VRVVSFKVDEDLLEMLEEVARKRNMSKSEIIRAAIRAYLSGARESKPFISRRIRIYG